MSSASETPAAWQTALLRLLSSSGPVEASGAIARILMDFSGPNVDSVFAILIGSTKINLAGLSGVIQMAPRDLSAIFLQVFPPVGGSVGNNMTLMNITGWVLYGAIGSSPSLRESLERLIPMTFKAYDKCFKAFKSSSLRSLDVDKAKISDTASSSGSKVTTKTTSAKTILKEKKEELDMALMEKVEALIATLMKDQLFGMMTTDAPMGREHFTPTLMQIARMSVESQGLGGVKAVAEAIRKKLGNPQDLSQGAIESELSKSSAPPPQASSSAAAATPKAQGK